MKVTVNRHRRPGGRARARKPGGGRNAGMAALAIFPLITSFVFTTFVQSDTAWAVFLAANGLNIAATLAIGMTCSYGSMRSGIVAAVQMNAAQWFAALWAACARGDEDGMVVGAALTGVQLVCVGTAVYAARVKRWKAMTKLGMPMLLVALPLFLIMTGGKAAAPLLPLSDERDIALSVGLGFWLLLGWLAWMIMFGLAEKRAVDGARRDTMRNPTPTGGSTGQETASSTETEGGR